MSFMGLFFKKAGSGGGARSQARVAGCDSKKKGGLYRYHYAHAREAAFPNEIVQTRRNNGFENRPARGATDAHPDRGKAYSCWKGWSKGGEV